MLSKFFLLKQQFYDLSIIFFLYDLGKPQKMFPQLMARPFRPYPLELNGHQNFFSIFKKKFFYLMNRPLPPSLPLNGKAISGGTFLRLPSLDIIIINFNLFLSFCFSIKGFPLTLDVFKGRGVWLISALLKFYW